MKVGAQPHAPASLLLEKEATYWVGVWVCSRSDFISVQFPGIEPQFLGRLNVYSNVSAGQEACIATVDNVGTKHIDYAVNLNTYQETR